MSSQTINNEQYSIHNPPTNTWMQHAYPITAPNIMFFRIFADNAREFQIRRIVNENYVIIQEQYTPSIELFIELAELEATAVGNYLSANVGA